MKCSKKDMITRLRRIEGQVKGIQRMIENDEDCTDILVQIAAIRAAINKVGGVVLENYSKTCIRKVHENKDSEEEMEKLINTIVRFTKWIEHSEKCVFINTSCQKLLNLL